MAITASTIASSRLPRDPLVGRPRVQRAQQAAPDPGSAVVVEDCNREVGPVIDPPCGPAVCGDVLVGVVGPDWPDVYRVAASPFVVHVPHLIPSDRAHMDAIAARGSVSTKMLPLPEGGAQ